jgi:DMSO/TMAO reductase YedYZ molybdopterin-dependent catalytic subunit
VTTRANQRLAAGLSGLLAAGVTVGVGELLAALTRPSAAPIIVVGNRLILLTPESVKRWAISQFGTGDKHALLTGIYLVLSASAIAIGLLARRNLRYGLAGVALLGLLGSYCAVTAHAARASDVIPSLLGAVAGMYCLARLIAAATPAAAEPRTDGQLLPARRGFLGAGLAVGVVAVLSGLIGKVVQNSRFDANAARAKVVLPPATDAPTASTGGFDLGKSGVPFQTPSAAFYRIDTALSVPQLDPKTWQLRIHGKVKNELLLTYDQLLSRPLVERWITLACVSNEVGGDLISTALFRGVLLADVLREAGIDPGADQLLATSSDGMTIGSPTAVVLDGRDAMLAVGMNGEPLPVEHGFPVRMVVPGLYGYVSACKWIVDLQATTFAASAAYWVQGGWAQQGPVKLASRIDRPSGSQKVPLGAPVVIAGVAWDQHVGVSRVEVQVDDEPWQQATLARVPSADTWRQWAWPWTPAASGVHRLRVRAYDANGNVQDAGLADPFPSGASGLHTVTVHAN